MRTLTLELILVSFLLFSIEGVALADGGVELNTGGDRFTVSSDASGRNEKQSSDSRGSKSSSQGGSTGSSGSSDRTASSGGGSKLVRRCDSAGVCQTCETPAASGLCPGYLNDINATGRQEAAPPTPEEIRNWAISVATSVRLPAPAVGVDPDPSVNRWRIVAVGQPLWLHDNSVSTVASSAANQGMSVSISARRTGVRFDMQERVITCTSMTRRPANADPKAKSPDCGYTYQRKGDRRITATATWQITWHAANQSGTVPMTRTSTRTLPVRELLAVNTRPS